MQSNQNDSQSNFEQSLFVANAARLNKPNTVQKMAAKHVASPKVGIEAAIKPTARQEAISRIQMSTGANEPSSRIPAPANQPKTNYFSMKATTPAQTDATFKNESVGKVAASQATSASSMAHGNFMNLMERFNGMAKTANVNTNEISQAFTKGEELEKVDIQKMSAEGQ